MKITKKIAAATLVPAAAAGITVSSLAVASADPPSGRAASSRPTSQAENRYLAQATRHQAEHHAKPAARKKAGKSAGPGLLVDESDLRAMAKESLVHRMSDVEIGLAHRCGN